MERKIPSNICRLLNFIVVILGITIILVIASITDCESVSVVSSKADKVVMAENSEDRFGITASLPGGFYDEGTVLTLTANADKYKIYYTVDNTIPTQKSTLYKDYISLYDPTNNENIYNSISNITTIEGYLQSLVTDNVDKALVIKAIAVDLSGNVSDMFVATYYVGEHMREKYSDMKTISVTADPDDLFGDDNGIYVLGSAYEKWVENGRYGDTPVTNYRITGSAGQRNAHFEISDRGQECVCGDNCFIEIKGSSSRECIKKRFRLQIPNGSFKQDILSNRDVCDTFILNTGEYDYAFQYSMEDTKVAYQRSEAVHLFLEGEYWGEYYLLEDYDEDYFENYYGIPADKLSVICNGELDYGTELNYYEYKVYYDYVVQTDFTQQEEYELLSQIMDLDSYIDYICFQTYFVNLDWTNTKNYMCWKSNEVLNNDMADGRWHWAIYDIDCIGWIADSVGADYTYEIDSFSTPMPCIEDNESLMDNEFFKSLLRNEEFRDALYERYSYLINYNFNYKFFVERINNINHSADGFDVEEFLRMRRKYMLQYLDKNIKYYNEVED